MAIEITLDFDPLDELPGRLRLASNDASSNLQLSPRMALQLANRLEDGKRLNVECQELRRAIQDFQATKVDWVEAQSFVVAAVGMVVRRIALVGCLGFAAGVAVGVGLHFAGWF